MARFKKRSRRFGGFRSFGRKAYRHVSGYNPTAILIPAAIYGAARAPIKAALQPVTNMLPLGGYGDELVMGILGFLAAKKGKGMVKNAGLAVLSVEAASAGQSLAGGIGLGSTGSAGAVTVGYGGWI